MLLAATAYAQTTYLFEIVKTGTPQEVQAAIDKGAEVNVRDPSYGATALMLAAHNQNPDVIITLLKSGADANVRDNSGKTALDNARGKKQLKGTDALKQLEEASK